MQKWEAESLGHKLATSFPRSSITPDAWADELADLQLAPAEEAVRRIIRTSEYAPTIAAYHSLYRSLFGTARTSVDCTLCAGSGWITDRDHPAHWPGDHTSMPPIPAEYGPDDGCNCNVVTTCHCPAGQAATNTRRKT